MRSFMSSLAQFLAHCECLINMNYHHCHGLSCCFVIMQSVRFQIGDCRPFLSWSIMGFSWEESWISKWSNPLSQSISTPPWLQSPLLPPSTLSAFQCSWSYLFFNQLRVLLNLFFFWLPNLVLRHSTPCPVHDKNAWECSASHIPLLSEHPVPNAPWEAGISEAFPHCPDPPLSQWSGGDEGQRLRDSWGKAVIYGSIGHCPRPVLSSQSLKRDIKRLLFCVCWRLGDDAIA